MRIVVSHPNPLRDIKEHDRILLQLLAQRAHEWQREQGVRRLITRLKVP